MELHHLRQILNRYWWIIAAGAIILGTIVLAYNLTKPPKYEASMSLIIVPRPVDSLDGGSNAIASVEALERRTIAETLGEVARSRAVVEEADTLVDFNLLEMMDNGSIESNVVLLPSTNVISIEVTGHQPGQVALATDAIGRAAQNYATNLRYPYVLEVLDPVDVPTRPQESNLITNAVLGFVVGGFSGFGIAFALNYLNQSQPEPKVRQASIAQ